MKKKICHKKGISPLIASVLLIAFTMAIAGIMATWATTFTRQKLAETNTDAECLGAIDLSSLSFNNGTISIKIRNLSEHINLTDIRSNIEYSDATKNTADLPIKDFNATDPLSPGATTFFVYNTGDSARPKFIEMYSSNCKRQPVTLQFR